MKHDHNSHHSSGWFLMQKPEHAFKRWAVPLIPKWIETYHLTMLTLLWSALIVFFGYKAQFDNTWLWGISIMLVLQWVTDLFDGEVGRQRNTGLVQWGFYMDHLLDYFFLASIVVGYGFLIPTHYLVWYLGLGFILGGFMVSSYLLFATSGNFKIYYYGLGPTEFRMLLILINTSLIYNIWTGLSAFIPYLVGILVLGLIVLVVQKQRILWKHDMVAKGPSAQRPRRSRSRK